MTEYAKSPVNNVVTVKSIVTALRADLRNWTAGAESHDFPEIFYMAQGQGHTTVNGMLHRLEAGQLIIYGPNSTHGGGSGGMAEIISFETESPLPKEYCDRVITLTGSQRTLLHQIMEQTLPMFEKRIGLKGMVLKRHVDRYAVQNTKNKLELFLLDIICPVTYHPQDDINTITDYMMKNIHRSLTLEGISRELGMSIPTVKRLVQKSCGCAPMAYFNDLKILEAKRLISDTPLSITQIADRLGFSSVHYFSRVFKQKCEKTPSDYKKDLSQQNGS